ncbi:MAG: VLRF1 family aeRF1-type release factor [Acidobacteriota bacterium]|nr:VLRF1 family aeRF1-type release factor [Acidobacteriota bacterium]
MQSLSQRLEVLAAAEPSPFPVVSLYLDLSAANNGRENHDTFIRKAFADRAKGLPNASPERQSFEQDHERIRAYLGNEVNRSSKGVAIFASAGAGLFEAIQVDAPIDQHWLFIGSVPHLYPLARLIDTYPRYAAVILDTNKAQIFVFGLGSTERTEQVTSKKTRRTSKGGWSQARYQRRADNVHEKHIKEVIETLDKLVREEQLQHIVIAGDEVALSILRNELPKQLTEKLVDITKWDRTAGEQEILQASLDALRDKDAETDIEKVEEMLNAWRSGGLGVAGTEATMRALQNGQVDELVIAASPETLKPMQNLPDDSAPGEVVADTSAPQGPADESRLKLSDELVTRAQQTAARVRFIEDANLLADVGGVGALLRYRI